MLGDNYKITIKNMLLIAVACANIVDISAAAQIKVKVTNKTPVTLAVALIRTKKDSDYSELYGEYKKIKVRTLKPNEVFDFNNFSQDLDVYDRVLWVVPLELGSLTSNLKDFAGALIAKNRGSYDLVKAFEVGSAKEVTISGTSNNLKVTTKGKWVEGAKSYLKSLPKGSGKSDEPADQLGGFTVADLNVEGKLAKIEQSISGAVGAIGAKAKELGSKAKEALKRIKYNSDNDPEGWPLEKMTFDEVADVLGLSSSQKKKLKQYVELSSQARTTLGKEIRDAMNKSKASKQEKAKAYGLYLKYKATFSGEQEGNSDPEGWPTQKNIAVYRSFEQAVKDLGLSKSEIEELRNYGNSPEKRQQILNHIEEKYKKNKNKSTNYAWLAIKQYAKYYDQIPLGVR